MKAGEGKYKARRIYLGGVAIGGGAPVLVQSMTNTDTRDVEATMAQIARLQAGGCEAVRLAVPDMAAVSALRHIRARAKLPLIADIHFDWRLAVASLEEGMDCVRVNPGNLGGLDKLDKVADAAKAHGAAIRIGVNSGSIEKDLLAKHGGPCPMALVESGLGYLRHLEERAFENVKLSLKSSSVMDTIEACRLMRNRSDCPLHIGITEAGGLLHGAVKSSVGLGILLCEGIGETMRVSLTAEPEKELVVAWDILRALGLRERGPEIVSCPTCGRTEIDLIALAKAVEKRLEAVAVPIKVAVMGCVVNGPGEAREADIGIAGGRGKGVIFRKGHIIRSVEEEEALLSAFMVELQKVLDENGTA